VTGDPDGNVYIAAGQIYVIPRREVLDTIKVPEPADDLVFAGGTDGRNASLFLREARFTPSRPVRPAA